MIQHFILNQLINLSVYQLLTTLDDKKSAGLHNISNKFLKIAASVITPSLTEVFTASTNNGIFPYEWKASRVTPVFKSGTRNNPGMQVLTYINYSMCR